MRAKDVLCVPTWTCHSPLAYCTAALSGSIVAWQTMSVVYSCSSPLSDSPKPRSTSPSRTQGAHAFSSLDSCLYCSRRVAELRFAYGPASHFTFSALAAFIAGGDV